MQLHVQTAIKLRKKVVVSQAIGRKLLLEQRLLVSPVRHLQVVTIHQGVKNTDSMILTAAPLKVKELAAMDIGLSGVTNV